MNSNAKIPICTCQFPRLIARNMHGHGNDPQGNPCPVGIAWEEKYVGPDAEDTCRKERKR